MTLKCIVTDDEPLARKGLQGYIEKIPFLKLVTVCEDALQLSNELQQQNVDLLFLDIEMPVLTGIDFLKTCNNPPKVIFTTAYESYAVQGFELDVLDYLLKPISFERFLKSANKAADYFNSQQQPSANYLFIKTEGRLEKIFFSSILFIEALENYIAVYTKDKKIISHATLKSIQQVLPSQFIQSHKSYIINPLHIQAVQGNLLHIEAFQIPISKNQKENVLEKIINRNLLKG